jgi:hypothetical protein
LTAAAKVPVTVKVAALEVFPLKVAVMVLVPRPAPVAMPLGLMEATAEVPGVQVTEPEMSPVLPSE